MTPPITYAPGWPGTDARWTSSAKTGVGTAMSQQSGVWFTLSDGICNEVFYPRLDQACIRDLGLIVTDGADFFSEEKRDAEHQTEWLADGVPAFKLTNTCRDDRYRIEKLIVTDPHRPTVLQHVRFSPRQGALADYRLYALLAPHLANHGSGNTAWVGEFEGKPVLFAQRNDCALALACSVPLLKRSAGFVGASDGWQDLKQHGQMTWDYDRAENGNVALTAEVDLPASREDVVLALGFGKTPEDAARNATASLRAGFDKAMREYISGWQRWMQTCSTQRGSGDAADDLTLKSLAVLRTHESKTAPGALIASLSIPWGGNKGDNDQGGYHLVWGRDMVETAGGFLAAGAHGEVLRVLLFLQQTQQADGHWSQNMWLDGSPYWNGIQMDETALPILLVDLARRENALTADEAAGFWPMVKKAAGYLARNGPVSPQDRWEEDPGYTPFTVVAEIAALLVAAELADANDEAGVATHLRELADVWNASIERWMYMSPEDWCRQYKVDGYYVRIAPDLPGADGSHFQERIQIRNVDAAGGTLRADHLISPDALALVRFGLRAADDVRIRDTAKVIDALLRTETPDGPTWHRYNGDGYGEHEDGSPFDGIGIGRGWPLLTGERAHFELAAGRPETAEKFLAAMHAFANESGLISEQVWDSADLPERGLRLGRPSGSAMPLVWAHAEYLKLQRSLRDGRIFDQPPQTVQRYLRDQTGSPRLIWRFNHKLRSLPPGKILRIELMAPAVIRWTTDDWKTCYDEKTRDAGLGIHLADLATQKTPEGQQVKFTFHWPDAGRWEGEDFTVPIVAWDKNDFILTKSDDSSGKIIDQTAGRG